LISYVSNSNVLQSVL